MAERPLSADEAALWARVLETVRPMRVAPKPAAKVMAARVMESGTAAKPVARDAPVPRKVPPPTRHVTPAGAGAEGLFERLLVLGVGGKRPAAGTAERARSAAAPAQRGGVGAASTLDGSWDRKLSRGLVSPDRSIDLHGHNLSTAYATLDGALEQSIRMGDRVILLVTGKPPRADSERPHARGAIRAAIGDWLAGSRHAAAIAAVRGAHPRHGGAGALYIVLRRAEPKRVY